MNKAILFSQRRWNSNIIPAFDTIEEYIKLLEKQDSVVFPQWKTGRETASEDIPFQHKDIKTGYIHSSKFRKNVDENEENYMGKVGHIIKIEWIKDGNELSHDDKKLIMKDEEKIPLYNFDDEKYWEYFSAKVFWMKVTEITVINPPIDDTQFINYYTNENLKRPPIQYTFVKEI
jgi:hypothetical protein